MDQDSLFDKRVPAQEPPKLGGLALMLKDSLSDWQQKCLRQYLETKNKEISATFVFRFQLRHVLFCAVVTVSLSVLVLLLIPAATVCSLQYSFIAVIVAVFLSHLLYLFLQANASAEHWRLLRSIIDWNTVARLSDDQTLSDFASDGGRGS